MDLSRTTSNLENYQEQISPLGNYCEGLLISRPVKYDKSPYLQNYQEQLSHLGLVKDNLLFADLSKLTLTFGDISRKDNLRIWDYYGQPLHWRFDEVNLRIGDLSRTTPGHLGNLLMTTLGILAFVEVTSA
jgi:hypothetical protein